MQQNVYKRIFKHLFTTRRDMLSCFPKEKLLEIENTICHSEKKHMAELLCVIESSWDFKSLWQKKTTRERALQWFGSTRLWDTELNMGVLIYISFSDRQIEIITDRGIAKLITNDTWQAICLEISKFFKKGSYIDGIDFALKKIEQVLINVVPRNKYDYQNEYPNQVIII